MRCEACGAQVPPDSLECGRCGAELPTVVLADAEGPAHGEATTRIVDRNCSQCGEGLSVGARFCQACGAAARTDDDLFKQARDAAATARDSFLEQVRAAASQRYEILRELGHGGFATVFLAHEKSLGRDVALKVLHMNLMHDEDLVQRFATEARTLASLRHRHVLRIHAVEDFTVAHCFVMEYVAGQSLESVQRAHTRLPVAAVQAIAYQVAEALDYAHGQGVIHRDIKPANVMLDEFGEVVVMDFGIAKIVAGSGTQQSVMMGTPQYMSPEQFRGSQIGPASDQYSLGVMLYRLLCGRAPFQDPDLASQMNAVWSLDPEPVTSFRPDCPPHIADAVGRMLRKSPEARFPSCGAAAEAMGGTVVPAGHEVRRYLADLASMRQPESVPDGPLSLTGSNPLLALQTDPGLTKVEIEPIGRPLLPGEQVDLVARAVDDAGTPVPGFEPSWTVEGDAVSLSEGGQIVALKAGQAVIKVTSPVTPPQHMVVTVVPPPVDSVMIHSHRSRFEVGEVAVLSATPLDAEGGQLDSRTVVWSSDEPDVAKVTPQGLVTGRAPGTATITASCEGKRASAEIEVFEAATVAATGSRRALTATAVVAVAAAAVVGVSFLTSPGTTADDAPGVPAVRAQPEVARVAFEPDAQAVRVGGRMALRATALDEGGEVVEAPISWTVSDTSIATLVGDSLAEFKRVGSVTITAAASGQSASALLTVVESARGAPARAARVVLRADVTRLYPGDSIPVGASALDAEGALLDGRPVALTSSDHNVVTLHEGRTIVALNPGTAILRGTADSASAELEISVVPVPVREVRVRAETDTVRVDEVVTLGLDLVDARGGSPSRSATWSVDDAGRASISSEGRLTGLAAGPVVVTAEVDGIRGFYSLLVVGSASEDLSAEAGADAAEAPFAGVSSVAAGGASSCALSAERVLCWGLDRPEAAAVSTDLVSVSMGTAHACGLTSAGQAVCWGENRDGQLGTGGGASRSSPGEPVVIPGGERLQEVTAGGDHSCALTVSGRAFCWGKNSFGQNGDGSTRNNPAPTAVRASVAFRTIAAGGAHTCAIGTDGAVYCWGDNFSGAVGSFRFEAEPLPVNVDDGEFGFARVYAGGKSTCALTGEGEAYCWGENRYGQVGVGNRTDRVELRRPVQRDVRFSDLALGERHVCGLSGGGELYCWGDNALGQLGNGASAEQRGLMVPTEVQTTVRFSSVAAGQSHSCAVAVEGGVYCWGDNSRRQVGSPSDARVLLPTRLGGSAP